MFAYISPTGSIVLLLLQDNGTGMPHKDIPQLLGRVLSGTKYGVQQTRGKFGLGAKMALIWSKMSTGLPIDVRSSQQGSNFTSHYSLDINIHKCAPMLTKGPVPTSAHSCMLGAEHAGAVTLQRRDSHPCYRTLNLCWSHSTQAAITSIGQLAQPGRPGCARRSAA